MVRSMRDAQWVVRAGIAGAVMAFALAGCKVTDPLADREEAPGSLAFIPEAPASRSLEEAWTGDDDPAGSSALPVIAVPEAGTANSGGERIHVVRKGDTLTALARQYYNDASRWRLILESNRDQITDPNFVRVGQRLRIP